MSIQTICFYTLKISKQTTKNEKAQNKKQTQRAKNKEQTVQTITQRQCKDNAKKKAEEQSKEQRYINPLIIENATM